MFSLQKNMYLLPIKKVFGHRTKHHTLLLNYVGEWYKGFIKIIKLTNANHLLITSYSAKNVSLFHIQWVWPHALIFSYDFFLSQTFNMRCSIATYIFQPLEVRLMNQLAGEFFLFLFSWKQTFYFTLSFER